MFVDTKCTFCDIGDFTVLAPMKFLHISRPSFLVRCNGCGLAYLNPRYSMEEEEEFYAHECYEVAEGGHWYENREVYFQQAFQRIEASFKTGGLLDVGCGKGYFLDMARKRGWDVCGVDPSKEAALFARDVLKLDVFVGGISEANFKPESFDVITAWNVLDHMYDPWGDVQHMFRVLKRGGLLSIRVLNLNSHLFLYYLSNTLNFITRNRLDLTPLVCFHPFMFSSTCIKRWLSKAGFVDIQVENSALVPGTSSIVTGKTVEPLFRGLLYSLSQLCYCLSLKTVVIGPSLMIFARKP